MLLIRLLPLLAPIFIFCLNQVFFFFPKFLYIVLVFSGLVLFFVFWRISLETKVDKKWWDYFLLPVLLSFALTVYSIFLTNKILIQILFILNSIILYSYIKAVYYYLIQPEKYKAFSIENISSAANLFCFFLIAAIIYGLQSFLNFSVALSAVAMLFLVVFLVYQNIWSSKISQPGSLSYIFIICLIIIELMWLISFLPVNFNISALTISIVYYIIIGLTKNYLSDQLDNQTIRSYLIFGFVGLAIIFASSKWF